jgi:[protein-PII] uridylyltransferase
MEQPLILVSKKATRGGTEIFVHAKDQHALFADVVAEIDRRNLNVHDAQVMISKDGYVLDTFMVLDQNGDPIDEQFHRTIINSLTKLLEKSGRTKVRTRRAPRQLKHFNVKTQVDFIPTKTGKRTLMEFTALDIPGLLATVGESFSNLNINLHGAKITTFGERAQDLFIMTSSTGKSLTIEEQEQLRNMIVKNVLKLAEE